MASLISRRASHILLILLGLFLAGTIVVLTTVNAYFSIDGSAYILPEELGTWDEIRFGSSPDGPDSWAARIPWIAKMTHHSSSKASTSSNLTSYLAAPSPSQEAAAARSSSDDLVARPQPWRDNSVKAWDPSNPPEKIPRIIHQTWKDDHLPPRWQAIRDECAAMHPDYEYKLWTDADSRKFIAQHYEWFLPVFDGYPYPIQRADAIRYFVLHHYGGIYMDLDIGCLRRFDPLLRFEVVLPKTIPVGVSNDVMLSAKGHPFMDQLIHNLVTFNHQYLTNYPTVMFSTGPMFVSASYGLYVDVHGPATPSTPKQPDAGFRGVRVLPKSLYGKNVKPSEAPDSFFSHFYGSSWHANDAGFLIFLRKYGRLLIFIGVCVVAYGLVRTLLPKVLWRFTGSGSGGFGSSSSSRRRRSEQGWIRLPVGPMSSRSISRRRSKRRSTADEDRSLAMDNLRSTSNGSGYDADGIASTSAANPSRHQMPAPRPHKLSLPLFQMQDPEPMTADPAPQSVLAWMGQTLSRPSSRNDTINELEANRSSSNDSPPKKKGVLYLPAYFVRGDDGSSSSSQQLSPSSSSTSSQIQSGVGQGFPHSHANSLSPLSSLAAGAGGASHSLGQWASSLIPANWRVPSPAPSHGSRRSRLSQDVDLESLGSQDGENDEQPLLYGRSSIDHTRMGSANSPAQSLAASRQAVPTPPPPPYEDSAATAGSPTGESLSIRKDSKQGV
ncbi:hypothetical protein BCV70DRAFT_100948 [Testicularia cyperi]|uniref:Glycosyltransferase family 32 protein n=1 Tax=Testicularia cyperi TaxID=1882483 RepID=A0A317XTZ9_9BASI|nr:hypothetical protein BCV70DRAFT_100948 [Testicularia cyperi]